MVYFYSLMNEEKNFVSGFIEFDEEIKNANDGKNAFDNLLKVLSKEYEINFTRQNTTLMSFSKL